MKILFAVSNENISDSIVKTYQKSYKEILSYKNVYYFNAILKEIQKDKSYDRIVISEDLEPFANNNYDTIDKFLFEKLDSISDDATTMAGDDTPIILICTDRRVKSEQMLIKYFGIGIYNAVIGQDRSVEEVCRLINKPRVKKEAKSYYKIDSEDVGYQSENEADVSESEIQSILVHYKRLGKNEERYVESFNNIAAQYTDAQLKLIINFLPLNVKATLEARCPKYQELMTFDMSNINNKKSRSTYTPPTSKTIIPKETAKIDIIDKQFNKPQLDKGVIIPSAVNTKNIVRIEHESTLPFEDKLGKTDKNEEQFTTNNTLIPGFENEEIEKPNSSIVENEEIEEQNVTDIPKKRGRPRKIVEQPVNNEPKRGRGRPKKIVEIEEENNSSDTLDLFNLDEQNTDDQESVLPGFEDDIIEEDEVQQGNYGTNTYIPQQQYQQTQNDRAYINNAIQPQKNGADFNLGSLISQDKKVVSFVGTTKNGTSFIINTLAQLFASMGIKTAILDVTKSKNAYYIYTNNDEGLRKIAINCIDKLKQGIADGIQVNKNLHVYTALPGEKEYEENYANILSTLVHNYSLVLIDCDFSTNIEYFNQSQEIYAVQTMDVLTIQPLTNFLRDLKTKNIITNEKLKIVINKEERLRNANIKAIIGGMSLYNDPAMSFMTELFDVNLVTYCTIPFEEQNYVKYLESLVSCDMSLNGYTKTFLERLKALANLVYPLLTTREAYRGASIVSNTFSSQTNNTLTKMKNNL